MRYRQSLDNPFVWEKVVVNLLVKIANDYKLPWVYKYSRYGLVSDYLFVYVDDGQPIDPTETLC